MIRCVRRPLAIPMLLVANACRSDPPREATSVAIVDAGSPAIASIMDASPEAPPPHDDGFCEEGLAPITEDVCALVPDPDAGPPRLLVYLHGIVPPDGRSPQKTNVLRTVAASAKKVGVGALVPRGVRGVGPKGARDWLAWPTSPADHAKLARGLVERWSAAKKLLEARVGRAFARTYLAGSSNGAYFVTALALRGDLEAFGFHVDGLGAMSGGSASFGAAYGTTPKPPFYVGFGTYDADTKKNVQSLVAVLTQARWPAKVAEHPLGHGAREVYLDEAFVLWDAPR